MVYVISPKRERIWDRGRTGVIGRLISSAIVTTAYRPKRPPRKRKPQPAIATPIVAVKGKPSRFLDAPDLTAEEHRRRGDAADALFRELVRRATAT